MVAFGLLREGRVLAPRIHPVIGFLHFGNFFFKNAFRANLKKPYNTARRASLRDHVLEGLSHCGSIGVYFFALF